MATALEAFVTVRVVAEEVTALKSLLPANTAVMVCDPEGRVVGPVSVRLATPELTVAVPSEVVPSKNCTVPVGRSAGLPGVPERVAVNETGAP